MCRRRPRPLRPCRIPHTRLRLPPIQRRPQRKKLAELYLGKWLRFTAPFFDISEDVVSLSIEDDRSVCLFPNDARMSEFHTLELGQSVTVIGELKAIDKYILTLRDGEIAR
jgi:hypothetical protein